jgi:hypothetical protein
MMVLINSGVKIIKKDNYQIMDMIIAPRLGYVWQLHNLGNNIFIRSREC